MLNKFSLFSIKNFKKSSAWCANESSDCWSSDVLVSNGPSLVNNRNKWNAPQIWLIAWHGNWCNSLSYCGRSDLYSNCESNIRLKHIGIVSMTALKAASWSRLIGLFSFFVWTYEAMIRSTVNLAGKSCSFHCTLIACQSSTNNSFASIGNFNFNSSVSLQNKWQLVKEFFIQIDGCLLYFAVDTSTVWYATFCGCWCSHGSNSFATRNGFSCLWHYR